MVQIWPGILVTALSYLFHIRQSSWGTSPHMYTPVQPMKWLCKKGTCLHRCLQEAMKIPAQIWTALVQLIANNKGKDPRRGRNKGTESRSSTDTQQSVIKCCALTLAHTQVWRYVRRLFNGCRNSEVRAYEPSSLPTGMTCVYVAEPTSQMQILRNQQVATEQLGDLVITAITLKETWD